jgi:hypothetical protein
MSTFRPTGHKKDGLSEGDLAARDPISRTESAFLATFLDGAALLNDGTKGEFHWVLIAAPAD